MQSAEAYSLFSINNSLMMICRFPRICKEVMLSNCIFIYKASQVFLLLLVIIDEELNDELQQGKITLSTVNIISCYT